MALFNSYSETNLRPIDGLVVTFDTEPKTWKGSTSVSPQNVYWKLTRRATRQFEYFGMTKAAAEACRDALVREYTREYARWSARLIEQPNDVPLVEIQRDRVLCCTSSIKPQPVAGDNWKVVAQIEETDIMISRKRLTSYDELEEFFQDAGARDADEASIAVTSATWNGSARITANYKTRYIESFNPALLDVYILDPETSQYVEAHSVIRTGTDEISFAADGNRTFYLSYNGGAIQSSTWTTDDRARPSITVTGCDVKTGWSNFGGNVLVPNSTITVNLTTDLSYGELLNYRAFTGFFTGTDFNLRIQPSTVQRVGENAYVFSFNNVEIARPQHDSGAAVSIWYDREGVKSPTFAIQITGYLDGLVPVKLGPAYASQRSVRIRTTFSTDFNPLDLLDGITYSLRIPYNGTPMEIDASDVVVSSTDVSANFTLQPGYPIGGFNTAMSSVQIRFRDLVSSAAVPAWSFVSDVIRIDLTVDATTGMEVTPGATTTDTGATFDWDWGDGSVETGLTASPAPHTYSAPGNYTITISGRVRSVAGTNDASWLGGVETAITLADFGTVAEIGARACWGWTRLDLVRAAEAVTIGASAFRTCLRLGLSGRPDFVAAASVGSEAFAGTETDEFTFRAANPQFGADAFATDGMTGRVINLPNTTMAQVQAQADYPFGISSGAIVCEDGTIDITQPED